MARDVVLQHAVTGSRSQSGFSIPSLLKGGDVRSERAILPKRSPDPPGSGFPTPAVSSRRPRAASVAAAATMFTWVVEQRSLSCLR
jgi:hypothetical protein